MTSTIDKSAVYEAYEDVRNDATETSWAILAYDDKNIVLDSTGVDYEEFKEKFTDDVRLYGFVRVNTGDELSRRTKFVLISWVGNNVSAIKRAKMSTDKAVVKSVIQNVAIEVQAHEAEELEEDNLKEALRKAGGANYGTGIRPE